MAFENSYLDELRDRISLSTVVGRRVKLQKNGTKFLGLCPFHNEKTPSFNVVDDKNFYHCFGCAEHGDIFSFVMKTEGLTFVESVEKLTLEAGLKLPNQDYNVEDKNLRTDLFQVCATALSFFQATLNSDLGYSARKYITSRKISNNSVSEFQLGFAPNDNSLLQYLNSKGIDDDLIIQSGLAKKAKSSGGSYIYSFFKNRLMFPISDSSGRTIAFGGRFLGDAKVAKVGKYINSPETKLFFKGQTLYNLKRARGANLTEKRVVVVEGYMDVIALFGIGINSVLAPLGTALSVAQVLNIWKFCDEPILCFDGDEAGKKAALSAAIRILPELKAGLSLQVAFMPMGMDPDDVANSNGAVGVERLLQGSTSLFEFIYQDAIKKIDASTPERLAKLEKHFSDLSSSIKDRVVSQNYSTSFKNKVWETFKRGSSFSNYKGKSGFSNASKRKKPNPPMHRKINGTKLTRRSQQIALAGLLNHFDVLVHMEEMFVGFFSDADLKEIFCKIQEIIITQKAVDSSAKLQQALGYFGFDLHKTILCPAVYAMGRQMMPDANPSDARKLLNELLAIKQVNDSKESYMQRARDKSLAKESLEQSTYSIVDKITNESTLEENRILGQDSTYNDDIEE